METPIITDNVNRICTVKLTEIELADRSQKMSEKKLKQGELEAKFAEVSKGYKTEINSLDLEVRNYAKIINNKAEERSLECTRFYHTPVENRTCVVRPDTGERLDERDMTDGEKKDYELRLFKSKEQNLPGIPPKPEEPKLTIITTKGKKKGNKA